MAFELPPLPYAFDALEPNIDAATMQIHHDKHHAAYVANANKALEAHPELASKTVEDLLWGINNVPEDIRTVIRNNAGGHANHSIFWTIMGPNAGGNPTGRIADSIKNTFGGYDQFKELLTKTAVGQFGSGWAWLVLNPRGNLQVVSFPNQDSPFMTGLKPLVGIDVWEHAYYLKYKNERPKYIAAWWNVVNWKEVAERYNRYRKEK